MKTSSSVGLLSLAFAMISAAIIKQPLKIVTSVAAPELNKRSPFSCISEELGVSPVEQEIFRTYFKKEDACFFQEYSDDYFEEIFLYEKPIEVEQSKIEIKIRNIKIVACALKKVSKALTNFDFLSVQPEKQAKKKEVVNAANYISTMWKTTYHELEAEDWDTFVNCFLDKDVPYKNISDFYEKFFQFDAKLRTILSRKSST